MITPRTHLLAALVLSVTLAAVGAKKLQTEIAKERDDDTLVDSLLFTQFADKATIIRKSPTFSLGDSNFQDEFRELQTLRDRLAHANDYAAKADDVVRYAALFGLLINGCSCRPARS